MTKREKKSWLNRVKRKLIRDVEWAVRGDARIADNYDADLWGFGLRMISKLEGAIRRVR